MAKDVSIAAALAALQAQGLTLTDEQKSRLADAAKNEMVDAARTVVANKLSHVEDEEGNKESSRARNSRVKVWTDRLMTLAADFDSDLPGQTVNRGQGTRTIRMIRVETPEGSLKVELSSE